MNIIDELKVAVQQLEVEVAALTDAEREVANWSYSDLNRRDSSSAQDERHERISREARERASQARQKVKSRKDLIAELTNSI